MQLREQRFKNMWPARQRAALNSLPSALQPHYQKPLQSAFEDLTIQVLEAARVVRSRCLEVNSMVLSYIRGLDSAQRKTCTASARAAILVHQFNKSKCSVEQLAICGAD